MSCRVLLCPETPLRELCVYMCVYGFMREVRYVYMDLYGKVGNPGMDGWMDGHGESLLRCSAVPCSVYGSPGSFFYGIPLLF